ncbi:unnamed protein product [Linum trigynum]|uniref:Uncharacterized protein n=1 Tax=Linum trigynum TaxID=586398 RepID=A0AAV2DKM9_9ROSI
MIELKYRNPLSVWQTTRARGGFSQSVWENISKGYDSFWNFASLDPGNNTEVSFWHDKWIPGRVLATSYPRVAAAAADPEAKISDLASHNGESVIWSLNLNFVLRGGAESERLDLIHLLSSLEMIDKACRPCRLIWNPDMNGNFSVSSCYKMLMQEEV